jgi:DNA-binding MarR family transcriptional regulator
VTDSKLELDKQICHSLYSASNALVRAYRPLLQPLDLTYPQYLVMMSLWQYNDVSIRQLSEHCLLDSGTLTPLLKRLEGKGLLHRMHSKSDERQKVISLSERGHQLKAQAETVPEQMACNIKQGRERALELKALCESLLLDLSKQQ